MKTFINYKSYFITNLGSLISWISKRFFIIILIIRSILVLRIKITLLIWVFLEINLIVFLPILTFSSRNIFKILRLKYFLVQAIGSSVLFISLIIIIRTFNEIFIQLIIFLRLLWKRGTPPIHFWFVNLIIDSPWSIILIIRRWQKLGPFYIIRLGRVDYINLVILISLIVALIGSLNQLSLKKIFIFSSIFTSRWVLRSILNNLNLWIIYFLIYSFKLSILIIDFNYFLIFYKEIGNYFSFPLVIKFFYGLLLLRMGGFPPLVGFFIKISILISLILFNNLLLCLRLILRSLFIIYIYIIIIIRSITFSYIIIIKNKASFYMNLYYLILILGLGISRIVFLLVIN